MSARCGNESNVFVEKVDSPIGDENMEKVFFPRLSPPVEKVDSPIGDENKDAFSIFLFCVFSRESRFPDRGRKCFNSFLHFFFRQ